MEDISSPAIYRCSFCSYTSTIKLRIVSHERIHTEEKPFLCSVKGCDCKFSSKIELSTHEGDHIKTAILNLYLKEAPFVMNGFTQKRNSIVVP